MNLREFINKTIQKIVLEDSSDVLGSKLTPEEKSKANQALNIIINQTPESEIYRWPNKSLLSYKQWDYIVEFILELAKQTNDNKYKKALSNIYYLNQTKEVDSNGNNVTKNSPLVNAFLNKNAMFKDIYSKYPFEFFQALEKAWEKIFYSEKWDDIINKYQDIPDGNFGRFVATYLYNSSRDFLKSELSNPDFKTYNYRPSPNKYSRNIYALKNNPQKNVENIFIRLDQFQNAMRYIINSAKKIGIGKVQQQALIALEEMVFNFRSYDEIQKLHPNLFSKEENETLDVVLVKSKLKSILNKVAKPMLEPYGVTPDIFSDPNWKTKHQNLPADIVDQIINQFNTTSKAGGTEKRQYTHTFKLFADAHKTPEEIAKIPSEGIYKRKDTQNQASKKISNSIHSNLNYNEKFIRLADSVLHEFGFPISFEEINWSDYIKAGKQLKATQDSKNQIKQYAENFISEVKRIINQ